MNPANRNALIAILGSTVLGLLVGLAGSDGGAGIGGIPLFALSVGLAFLVQWAAFLPAYLRQTERFFDLTGSITYVSIFTLAILLSPDPDARAVLLYVLVTVWAIRLGSFLFRRIRKAGADDRFEEIKPSFLRFLSVWTLQGLWVTLTGAAALAGITSVARKELEVWALVGFLVWLFGFGIEVVADAQKIRFRRSPGNRERFIQTGLWSRSRHPNYFGEITLWLGIALIAVPVLRGWQWVVLSSPLFVAVLLTRVSGIPLLEQKADRRWGGQEEYEAYKRRTPVLIPRL
jgi:steroid 5-alpha reductase family enzyme